MTESTHRVSALSRFQGVLAVDVEDCEIQLCLAAVTDGEVPEIQRVQVSRVVAAEFRRVVQSVLVSYRSLSKSADLVVHEHDALAKLDAHEVECVRLPDYEHVRSQLAALKNLPALDVFKNDKQFVDGLCFHVVVLKRKGAPAVQFFRSYNPTTRTLRRSTLFGLVLRQGTYDKLEESTLLFDNRIDCIGMGDDLFVLNKPSFQRIFKF